MKQLSKERAMAFSKAKLYEDMTYRQISEFQMEQKLLCMPFDVFRQAMEETLDRPIYTHEFVLNTESLRAELFDGAQAPSLEEIINLILEERRILIEL